MQLEPYTGSESPPQSKSIALRPKLVAWSSRVWRESPPRSIPLFKIEARIDPRDVEDRALAEALRPFSSQLQKISIYLLHTEEIKPVASWAVGRFDVDTKGAYMFFHDFLSAPNGMLMLQLMQTAGAATDMIMSVVPMKVGSDELILAVADYDLGIHNRIG